MIEKFLLDIGCKCGSKKNFSSTIIENAKVLNGQRWYFLTPVKVSDDGSGMKTATINMAFPFLAMKDDISEADVIARISKDKEEYEKELLHYLRKKLIVPNYQFSFIPFWANEQSERDGRKDFAGVRVHILNAVITAKYRECNLTCN